MRTPGSPPAAFACQNSSATPPRPSSSRDNVVRKFALAIVAHHPSPLPPFRRGENDALDCFVNRPHPVAALQRRCTSLGCDVRPSPLFISEDRKRFGARPRSAVENDMALYAAAIEEVDAGRSLLQEFVYPALDCVTVPAASNLRRTPKAKLGLPS